MGRRSLGWSAATVVAALAYGCNALTGAADLEIDAPPPEGGSEPTGAADASTDGNVRTDGGGGGGTGDAAPGCPKCDDGKCCPAPNVCLSNGTCGTCTALEGSCSNPSDCCAPNTCNSGGKCAATCSAMGTACTYAQRDNCCAGLGCDLFQKKCANCKNDGVACATPNGPDLSCCGGFCFAGRCISD